MSAPSVLLVTEDHTAANSGVTASVTQLLAFLEGAGVPARLLTVAGQFGRSADGRHTTVPVSVQRWRYARTFTSTLSRWAGSSLLHLHGVWTHPQWAAARYAHRAGVPFVLSPHNMLGRWLWTRSAAGWVRKSLYWKLIASGPFTRATAVHALSAIERDALRASFFPSNRIEVLPNAISLDEIDRELSEISGAADDGDYLLFLGRIHPVKGLEALLDAFARVPLTRGTRLCIAGPGLESAYGRGLADRVAADPRLRTRVFFPGEVHGSRKWSLLRRARAVCLPSHTEGLSLTMLEALAAGCPVITTPTAGPPEIADHGGIICSNAVESLQRAIAGVLHWSDAEITDRRAASRRLVEQKFSWRVVGPQYLDFYRSVAG